MTTAQKSVTTPATSSAQLGNVAADSEGTPTTVASNVDGVSFHTKDVAAAMKPEEKAASQGRAGVTKRGAAYFIDPKAIGRREGWNPRSDFGEIKLLAESIKVMLTTEPDSGGLLNDLRVKRPTKPREDGKLFELIDGDRRLSAIELLMKGGTEFPQGVPAKIDEKGISDVDQLIRMYTSNTGKPFTPMEEALAFGRMREAGLSVTQIATATGKGRGHVIPALALIDAEAELMQAVIDKKITAGQAKEIAVAARGDAALQRSLLADAIKAGKDKGAKQVMKAKVASVKAAKAKKKGGKVRKDKAVHKALSFEQIGQIGDAMSKELFRLMAAIGLAPDIVLTDWLQEDGELKVAYAFGVLQGLKTAAGAPVDLIAGK